MKNFILIIIIMAFFFFGNCNYFKGKKVVENGSINKELSFKPDISIGEKLFLNNPSSIENTIGDIMPLMNRNEDYPFIYIFNSTGDEYLKMTFYYGNEANNISLFEVGWSNTISVDANEKNTSFVSFVAESGVALNMSEEELLKIKGNNCSMVKNGDTLLISYVIDDFETSDFLKQYNMPIYIANYWIIEKKVVKYQFGFEYP